ncbi:MAG: IS4 family transposase [Cytophagaceae bacterium]
MLLERKIDNFSDYLSKFVSDSKIESFARASGFKKRDSPISPQAFLESVFFCNAQDSPSLSEYSIDLEQQGCKRVSKQAIDKRFNDRTKEMLTLILKEVMSKQLARKPLAVGIASHFTDVNIMDSSEFGVSKRAAGVFPGYGGTGREAMVQIQLEYQLFSSKVTQLSIGSALDSDAKEGMKNIDDICPKTLLIRDLGYFGPQAFKELAQRDLYFISRAKSQWNFYLEEQGELIPLSTADIIEKLKTQKEKYLDLDVFVGKEALSPVRLVANLLTEEQAKKRLKKKSANRKLGEDALESIGLNLFVTNVEREKCDAEAVYELYTLRWQIELVFKTWKSVIKLHKIHSMNATRLECIILIKLLWVMLNWSIWNRIKDYTNKDISFHKLSQTLQSRSKRLTPCVLRSKQLLIEWLYNLAEISKVHHEKEYKKGSKKNWEILAKICYKAA